MGQPMSSNARRPVAGDADLPRPVTYQTRNATEVANPEPHLADWDDAVPGFAEIDLVGHEGGNASGVHRFTLTVTDIATGWTMNRSVQNKAEKWVFKALMHITRVFPCPIIGIDSDYADIAATVFIFSGSQSRIVGIVRTSSA